MSNTITAYFKGRKGVAESLYQNDYGMVMVFDGIELPAHFDCYFSIQNQEEAVPGVGADNRVAIPNSVLANPGKVEIHIPLHTGSSDSEVEYVVYFRVIGRARPVDDGTPAQMTAIEQALALLQTPIENIEQIVNEALAFTGDTFAEMQEQLDADQAAFQDDMGDRADAFEAEIRGDIADVESDFDNLNAQFQTAVGALTVDDELLNVRVGDDNVTYATAGEAVRKQFSDVKSAFKGYKDNKEEFYDSPFKRGYLNNGNVITAVNYRICSTNIITVGHPICIQASQDYKFTLSYFVNGSYTQSTDWKQFLIVDAGSSFRIQIAKYTEDTSTPADINTFRANVTFADANKFITTEYKFDEIAWLSGEFVKTDGSIGLSASYNRTDYIEIPTTIDDKITFYCSATGEACSIAFYDSGKNFISQNTAYSTEVTADVPQNAVYFRATNNPSVINAPHIYVKKIISLYEAYAGMRKNRFDTTQLVDALAEENTAWED